MKNLLLTFVLLATGAVNAAAVPDTLSLRVTDVTTSSFSLIWMTDVAAAPGVEIYTDDTMSTRIKDVVLTPMPDTTAEVAESARLKGVMKARVSGLSPNTLYYARSVTADSQNPLSIGYSQLQKVTTAKATLPYTTATGGSLKAFANDMLSFKVYIRPSDQSPKPGSGDLLVLDIPESPYPVSAFVGAGTIGPEGIIDMNNLFSTNRESLNILGKEKTQILVYRGGTLSTLQHYRFLPLNSQIVTINEPVKGYFADINLDGKIDDSDFEVFRRHFRTEPDDLLYNPDYNFVEDTDGTVDARDFGRFAKEYGRTDVQ